MVTQVDKDQKLKMIPTKPEGTKGQEGAENLRPLLGAKLKKDSDKKTLIIDLDETLVHSSFSPIDNPDLMLRVSEI